MERMEARTTTPTDNEDELNEKQRANRLQLGKTLLRITGNRSPKKATFPWKQWLSVLHILKTVAVVKLVEATVTLNRWCGNPLPKADGARSETKPQQIQDSVGTLQRERNQNWMAELWWRGVRGKQTLKICDRKRSLWGVLLVNFR